MKKKVLMISMITAIMITAMLLTASSVNQRNVNLNDIQQSDSMYDKTDPGCLDEVSTEKTDDSHSELLCGPDVVELVNLRGDEAMAYKLVDGTYMDRIERRFTFNGTDTWTDEDGVEWNENVK